MSPLPRKKRDEPEDKDEIEVHVELEDELLSFYSSEERNIIAWREDELVKAGVTYRTAATLARSLSADLHEALKLKAKGCSDQLLLEILR